jgi:hypothetical protein
MLSRAVTWLARHAVPKTLTPRVVLPDNDPGRWFAWHLEPALVLDWRDWWRGLYWDAHEGYSTSAECDHLELYAYVTLVPCLVLRLHLWRLVDR